MAIKLTTYYHSKDIPQLPGSNTFHSKELFIVYENTKGHKPLMVVATENNVVLGKILAIIRKKKTFLGIPTRTSKCEMFGIGEYFCQEESIPSLFNELLQHITKEALRNAFMVECRNLTKALEGYKAFRTNNYFPVNWLRIRNKLQIADDIESHFSASRIRQIKKGLKNGAEAYEATSYKEVNQLAKMLHKIYSTRIRKHYPSIDFFQHIKSNLSSLIPRRATFYIVKYKDKIIGGSACVFSGDEAYLWFSGGMNKTHITQYPGILAVWKALIDTREKGYKHLEFMDVGLPFKQHAYRDFVLRFGGRQTSTRRWFQFRWSWLNNLCKKFAD